MTGMLLYLLPAWLFSFITYVGASLTYLLYMQHQASREWGLQLDCNEKPSVTILVPTYNEGRGIGLKLKNLSRLKYPKDLTQIVVIDSASTDNTIEEVENFVGSHPDMKLEILIEEKRRGKSHALNQGLKRATGEVIIVSDADCFWPSDILDRALPYLTDNEVGAVAGQEKLLNPDESWVTKTEVAYRDAMFRVQLGESKLHSTIQFEGGFGAYKKAVLDEFDCETGSDDSGTALNIVQKHVRAIVVPDAVFYTKFPTSWKEKLGMKIRRANQLLRIWIKCTRLLLERRLVLPKRIALTEFFLSLFGPFIFLALVLTSVAIMFYFPLLLLPLIVALVLPKTRTYLVEVAQTNLVLIIALFSLVTKRSSVAWKIAESSRYVEPSVLTERGLI